MKQKLCKKLQNESPKLAGVVHDAELKQEGKSIIISAKNDFAKRQLQENLKMLEKTLKGLSNEDLALTINIREKKKGKDNFVETIKTMFDSEEIR